jgi:dipeptidyl aminopeptidase/acylaminoacyl peptidase
LAPQSQHPAVAPFGTWSSPITAELVAQAGTVPSLPWLAQGTAWWLEGRPAEAGRVVLVRAVPGSEPVDVTPEGFNVRTMVHEYGGGAYCVHDGTVFFSNFADQRLYRQDPGAAPVPITPAIEDRRHRYADGRVTPDGRFWIGVRERHPESGRSADVVNELVALPVDGSAEPQVLARGRDFYSNPRVSPDGRRLCFLAWDLPWMPWDGNELFVAELRPDGRPGEPEHVAGRDGEESIWQPEWSPEGDLVFASDRSGWWNLERVSGGERRVLYGAQWEFGYPAWTFGGRSYAFLGDGRIVCAYDRDGRTWFALLDPESGRLQPLDLPYDAWRSTPHLTAEGQTALLVAGSATIPNQVVRLDCATGRRDVLRVSSDVEVDRAAFSVPEAIDFPTEGGRTAHALFYRPANPRFAGPPGERPPLIVMSHGGPTGNATALFDLELQFWTSRGFAVVDVNYGGSTGYGRAYRERLNGQWGVVDLQDCVNAARHLAARSEVDGAKLLIRGASAGGYTTICALTFTDEFTAGASYFGIADLDQFGDGHTHKFELRYEHTLVGPYPEARALYRERSPIHYADRIATPMLVLQGADDEIVPKEQAELIVAALRERGVPHAYLLFEGEGHGFRRADTIVRSLQAELSFYLQVLGLEPLDPLPRLPIEHLPD